MNTMSRDADHIAKTVRLLRKQLGLTQEALAELAGLSTRTIEKTESGRHTPEEQSLRSIARAFGGMDMAIFEPPTPQQEADLRVALERVKRKALIVPTKRIITVADFMREFAPRPALHADSGDADDDATVWLAASMTDLMRDLGDIWEDLSQAERVETARSFVDQSEEMRQLGRVWFMGNYRRRLRDAGKPDLVLSVTLASLQPIKGADGDRYAYVEMEGRWETLEQDRPRLPD